MLFILIYGWYKNRQDEGTYGRHEAPTPEAKSGTVLETFDDSLLFRELPVEIRTELANLARKVSVTSGNHVVGVGERGEDLYIVESGEFDVVVHQPKGPDSVVARLKRGDVFGELSFFGNLFRSQNLRAHGEGTLIAMSSPELEQTLKRFLSIPAIEEIVQKRTFLRRIPLSSGWEPHSIARFAKCARFEEMKEGQVIIGTGRENRFFYLVHEGNIEVRYRGRRKAKIHGGDFFGEISLMLNNLATADIIAAEQTRCLVLQKSDFLALMGQDVELALQMEHIASRRFGRPIFPFLGSSIEAIAN
jgi:cAMP-dependent protein kinase regulator